MLKIWVLDTQLSETLEKLSDDYEVENFGWDWQKFHTRLLNSLNEGSAPDLIEVGNTWTSRLAQEGILLNITQFVTEHLNPASIFFPQTLYSCRHAFNIDQYYALPILADVRLLFYSKKHLGNYLTDHPNAFKSWPAFEKLCQDLKEILPGRVIAWPLDGTGFHDLLPWVWLAGGDFVSQSGQLLMDSERTVEGIYRLIQLILTNCAPLPPHPNFNNPDNVRHQFIAGNIGIMAGAYWMSHLPGWQEHFKVVLHPPDLFPAAFIGGSNLALVRKYEANENDEAYETAKTFLAQAVDIEMQMTFARGAGKLPCNILAWEEMRKLVSNEAEKELLETFNKALSHTVERGMPNLSNAVQVEEELKTFAATIWEKAGKIKRMSPAATETELKVECKEMLRKELKATKQRIEKYLIGYTIQYTPEEIQRIGITPPEHFDLWLEASPGHQTSNAVYIKDRGEIAKGIGPNGFKILLALVNAPGRTIGRDRLLELVWHIPVPNRKFLKEVIEWGNQAYELVQLLEKSIGLTVLQFKYEIAPSPILFPEALEGILKELRAEIDQNPNTTMARIQNLLLKKIVGPYDNIARSVEQLVRSKADDNLRKTFKQLGDTLGEIRGIKMVSDFNQDGEVFYKIDKNLSVCLVIP